MNLKSFELAFAKQEIFRCAQNDNACFVWVGTDGCEAANSAY